MIHRCRIAVRKAGQYNGVVCTTDTDSDISRIVCETTQCRIRCQDFSFTKPADAGSSLSNIYSADGEEPRKDSALA